MARNASMSDIADEIDKHLSDALWLAASVDGDGVEYLTERICELAEEMA